MPTELEDQNIPFQCFESFDGKLKDNRKTALEEINDTVKVVVITSGAYG